MASVEHQAESGLSKSVVKRFLHLLSAQGVDSLAQTTFFLYLAWLDHTTYGEIMYALAAAGIAWKIVQFGLYFPLINSLGKTEPDQAPRLVNQVNLIKVGLSIPVLSVLYGLSTYRGFSVQMKWILLLVTLGYIFEALAETFFAEYRIRGRQNKEAGIKMASSILGYGFGFISAAFGLPPLVISLFRVVSGLVRVVFSGWTHLKTRRPAPLTGKSRQTVALMFKSAFIFALIEILGTFYNKTNILFMESVVGVEGIAFYSATYNIVDPVSILASQQLIAWVVFPVLASLWIGKRTEALKLVRSNALWLLAIAGPIMFVLHVESDTIIRLVYPDRYLDAVMIQKYLVWTIVLSFEGNLFAHLMMVAGARNMLLVFSLATTACNLLFNLTLIHPYGLVGGTLVVILTKLTMSLLTFGYCQRRFRLFRPKDALFPVGLALAGLGLHVLLTGLVNRHISVALVTPLYGLILWKWGPALFGSSPPVKRPPLPKTE